MIQLLIVIVGLSALWFYTYSNIKIKGLFEIFFSGFLLLWIYSSFKSGDWGEIILSGVLFLFLSRLVWEDLTFCSLPNSLSCAKTLNADMRQKRFINLKTGKIYTVDRVVLDVTDDIPERPVVIYGTDYPAFARDIDNFNEKFIEDKEPEKVSDLIDIDERNGTNVQ